MLTELDDYDWEHAFEYAQVSYSPGPKSRELRGFDREDIKRIIALYNGYGDGPNWLLIAQLKDEDYIFLTAGCDFTGWDCQAGGRAYRSSCLDDLVIWALSDEEKASLHIVYGVCQNCSYRSVMIGG